ncbi:MAG: T9SS type A sorting domain-containing protein [Bacteroidetes bacterium]|nr:T9SS type A sorting domain-containing protein [Bacteroidota bacterium]
MKSKLKFVLPILPMLFAHFSNAACNCIEVTDPSGEETWNLGNNPFNGECVTVKPGKKLTIEGLTLEFWCNGGRIKVERGGKLIIKDCTIQAKYNSTSGTFAGFEGIYIQGKPTVHHMNNYRFEYDPSSPNFSSFGGYNDSQGVLIMQNTTIKNVLKYGAAGAKGGIALESRDGGILELYNNTFENNTIDVYITNYNMESELPNEPNAFNIINCTFKRFRDASKDPLKNMSKFNMHVKLEICSRVQMEGCYFKNEFDAAYTTTFKDFKTGIFLNRASITLMKSGFNRRIDQLDGTTTDRLDQTTNCPEYNLPFARRIRFENLTYGIESDVNESGINNKYASISDCVFYNCHYGAEILSKLPTNRNNIGRVVVAKCVYELDASHRFQTVGDNTTGKEYPFFIKLSKVVDFVISENAALCAVDKIGGENFHMKFVRVDGLISNSAVDVANGEIYRNNIDVIDHSGNSSKTINGFICNGQRNNSHNTTAINLSNAGKHNIFITCNKFTNLKEPIKIENVELPDWANMSSTGSRDQAVENEFNNCQTPFIQASGNYPFKYKFYGSSDNPDPNDDISYINESSTSSSYNCATLGCRKWPTKYNTLFVQQIIGESDLFDYELIQDQLILINKTENRLNFTITNMQGQLLNNGAVISNLTSINVSSWAKGIYIISVSDSAGGMDSQKMIVH